MNQIHHISIFNHCMAIAFLCANQVICLHYSTNWDIKTIQGWKFPFILHSFSIDILISIDMFFIKKI